MDIALFYKANSCVISFTRGKSVQSLRRPPVFTRSLNRIFSIVDRTSFVVMKRLGLTRVASFDDHFALYGCRPNGSRASYALR
jgi:hypothetical protein